MSYTSLSAGLLDINEDILSVIMREAIDPTNWKPKNSFMQLASTCRTLRFMSFPMLFAPCAATYTGRMGIPPVSIRPFVRRLTYRGNKSDDCFSESFGIELPYLPALVSIKFESGGRDPSVPWAALKCCLVVPHLVSVDFGESSLSFWHTNPYPASEIIAIARRLTSLSYRPDPWRHIYTKEQQMFIFGLPPDAPQLHRLSRYERDCLSPLVLGMHGTATSIRLPMESAPMEEMARLNWPDLCDLEFEGEYTTTIEAPLRELLSHTPRLSRLSLHVSRHRQTGRVPILGRVWQEWMRNLELRSLTLTYPDLEDTLFRTNLTGLTHLALTDRPRHYHCSGNIAALLSKYYDAPIAAASEFLSTLRRLHMPRLTSLELVYKADNADEDLLHHIVGAFPKLSHLELHRYRKDLDEVVNHTRIGQILAGGKMLECVYLHLDFHDDPGIYVGDDYSPYFSYGPALFQRGNELANILQACPLLRFVSILCRSGDSTTWRDYHPPRYDLGQDIISSIDSELYPLWGRHLYDHL